ncbi:MAG: FAD-linked oxidase C-terminal domain-containing protein [Syntrophaceae bacterium]|nr:FAD-linked oxidase C-terminal domain-containing protein [Syntrophaceae bacterium]
MIQEEIIRKFREIVGQGACLHSVEDLINYSYDSSVDEAMPELVLLPQSTEQVSAIMKVANEEGIPVTPRGAGTNLSGGTVPMKGGIVLVLTRMNRLITLSKEDRYAIVEAGHTNLDLQNRVKAEGLFYPPDPASWSVSTLGGNVGENAGGPRGVKYGVTRDWLLGLKAVLADGRIIQAGGITAKNVTGIDLISLFTGSEGCLGIVTEVTVKLLPLPPFQQSIQAFFPQLDGASRTVARIIGSGIVPVALELMDKVVVNMIEDSAHIGLPRDVEGTLLIMVDGEEATCRKQVEVMETICREEGCSDIQVAQSAEEEDKLWLGRRSAFGVMSRKRPTCVLEDCTVPVSNLPAMIRGTVEIGEKYNLTIGVMAHAGDGNTHPMIVTDKRDTEEWERVEKAVSEIFRLAVDLGGTLSGEHGIGLSKKPFIPLIMNDDARRLMMEIKSVLDPKGILNPGKFIE